MGRIELKELNNTRDLGGFSAADGRTVKQRRLIRSGALSHAAPEDLAVLREKYGVHTVVDLRTPVERAEAPDPDGAGFRYVQLPLLDDSFFGIARDRYSVMSWLDMFADHSVEPDEVFCDMYRRLLFADRVRPLFRRFFELLLEGREGAVLWHCSAGKDRAGIATLLALSALGVPQADAVADYMMTGVYTAGEIETVERSAAALSTDPHIQRAVSTLMETREQYVLQLFAIAERDYGGILPYLNAAGILSPAEVGTLRDLYLEA